MELRNICKMYHNKTSEVMALNHIDLKINHVGMTFIIGPSGCGKTTLLNIMAGLDADYDGDIKLDGKVEYLTQEIMLFENMSILDNLLLVCEDKEKILTYLSKYGLNYPSQKVKYLSIGEKKRVQIIRSFLSDAHYFICDEPTAALDYENQSLIMEVLKDLSKERVVIIVTHRVALVDMYANRVIRMGKGCILEDVLVNEQIEPLKDKEERKKNLLHHLSYIVKKIKSRKLETLMQAVVLFMMILVVYIGVYLFGSLRQSSLEMMRWTSAKNVIITQPIDALNQDSPNFLHPDRYYEYDLFTLDDLEVASTNVEGLLGYRIGWDYLKFDVSPYGCSFIPKITYEEMKEIILAYKDEYDKTQVEPFPDYELYLYYVENDIIRDGNRYYDYTSYRAFKIKCSELLSPIPQEYCTELLELNAHIIPYQLFEGVSLDLMVGEMPTSDNDVLISKNVADELMYKWGLETVEELIGSEIDIMSRSYQNSEEVEISHDGINYTYQICGVTYAYSNYENQVFFKDGVFLDYMADFYQFDKELAVYQYITFLIDPSFDENQVASQLNRVLQSEKSEFVSYSKVELELTESYQSPTVMSAFVVFTLVCLLLMMIGKEIFFYKRNKKETILLKRYGYLPVISDVIEVLLIVVAVGAVQIILLPTLCQQINQFANSLEIADVVTYSVFNYLIAVLIALVLMLLGKGGFYVSTIKKHK